MEVVDESKEKFDALKEFALHNLNTAKEFMEKCEAGEAPTKTDLPATGFLCKCIRDDDGDLNVVNMMLPFELPDTPEDKEMVAAILRAGASVTKSDAVVWISDAIYWVPDEKKVKEQDISNDRLMELWPVLCYEARCKYADPSDCIMITIDAIYGHCFIRQSYKREEGKIVWGELEIRDKKEGEHVSGRFARFLEEEDEDGKQRHS